MTDFDPPDGVYVYSALVDEECTVDDPRMVIRSWRSPQGHQMEERYRHDGGWRMSWVREDVQDARQNGWLVEITEEAAERFKEILAERMRSAPE